MIKTLAGALLILMAVPTVSADQDREDLQDLTQRSEVVAVVKLIGVDPPLGLWSGYHAVVQYAKYEVEELIKGKPPEEKEIYVAHGVVHNSAIADADKRSSHLSFLKKVVALCCSWSPRTARTIYHEHIQQKRTFRLMKGSYPKLTQTQSS